MTLTTAWLHWIRKQNKRSINTVEFLGEARRLGILLPVSLSALSLMSWKDQIYLIHRAEEEKQGKVFCRLPVSLVSGFTEDAMQALVEEFSVKEVDEGGEFRERFIGDYLEGQTWEIDASLQEIYSILKKLNNTGIGNLLVGCKADEFQALPVPWARLTQVSYHPGFRQFNAEQFIEDVEGYRKTSVFQATYKMRLESEYAASQNVTRARGGSVQWVNYYTELDHEVGQLSLFA